MPGNSNNPYRARQVAKLARQNNGTFEEAQAVLWRAISVTVDILDGREDPGQAQLFGETAVKPRGPSNDEVLRVCAVLSHAVIAYAKLLEAGEWESRLKVLEEQSGVAIPTIFGVMRG